MDKSYQFAIEKKHGNVQGVGHKRKLRKLSITSSQISAPVVFYSDDGTSFCRNVCEMIADILAVIFSLKLSSKTHLNAPLGNF